jgi:hypothetical protein
MYENSRYYEYLYTRDSQQTPIAQFSAKQIATPRPVKKVIILQGEILVRKECKYGNPFSLSAYWSRLGV